MQRTIVFNSLLTIGGIKVCRFCSRSFRFVSINGEKPMRIDAIDDNGIGPRLVEHDCGRDSKALRSTIGHAKIIISRAHKCRCGAITRTIYLIEKDSFWQVDDFGPETPGELTGHECPKADDPQ